MKTDRDGGWDSFAGILAGIAGPGSVKMGEPMRLHTTFRIGGPADYYVTVHSGEEIRGIIAACREHGTEYQVLGNGSNVLVSDEGIRGVVIRLGKEFGAVRTEGTVVHAEAGALLSGVAAAALEAGLAGLEFAAGIPGTVGGACLMNAGAYGGEMKQVLREVTVLRPDGGICGVPVGEMELSYRHSRFMDDGSVILAAAIQLAEGDRDEIRARVEELRCRRQEKQPLDVPSAGSTFKRPEGFFAGKLIMDAGLRGFSVGGAQVSGKHCGFVVNTGDARAEDVRDLIREVQRRVKESFGVDLVPEIRFLGEFHG